MSIDYGRGLTNIDFETGIRYGVIPQNDVLQAWADESEGDYGSPTCPDCGENVVSVTDDSVPDLTEPFDGWEDQSIRDYACLICKRTFDADDCFGDEPNGFTLDDGEYQAHSDSYGDIFVTKSPYYTRASFCSPCAPGACHLRSPNESGQKAYCFAPDWFDAYDVNDITGGYYGQDTSCPYPVYRVSDDVCIFQPKV